MCFAASYPLDVVSVGVFAFKDMGCVCLLGSIIKILAGLSLQFVYSFKAVVAKEECLF